MKYSSYIHFYRINDFPLTPTEYSSLGHETIGIPSNPQIFPDALANDLLLSINVAAVPPPL